MTNGDLLIDGQVVDTYGGDFTYRDVWVEYEGGRPVFYELYYGAKPEHSAQVTDREEIQYLKTLIIN